MPLIVFSRDAYISPITSDTSTQVLDRTKHVINLPRRLHNKEWVLKSVKALSKRQTNGTQVIRMRHVEIFFPQLMREDSVYYFRKSQDENLPSRALRFYPTSGSHDQRSVDPHTVAISVCPEIRFGVKRIEELFLEMEISAELTTQPNGGEKMPLTSYEIILEYN